MSDTFIARPGSWEVAYSNGDEEYLISNVSYNSDNGSVEVKFLDDFLSFDSMESFDVLVDQLTIAVQTVFNQNKVRQ
jgi:hypothetical protein